MSGKRCLARRGGVRCQYPAGHAGICYARGYGEWIRRSEMVRLREEVRTKYPDGGSLTFLREQLRGIAAPQDPDVDSTGTKQYPGWHLDEGRDDGALSG